MNGAPSIYGPLTPEAETSYTRWIMSLFDLTQHQMGCRWCVQGRAYCVVGRDLYTHEQYMWKDWHAVRGGDRGDA